MNENNFDFLFNVDISNINEFSLKLKRKEEDLKSNVEKLSLIIKKQEETIKKLEEESNNKIKKLEEEFNKKIKQFEDKSNNKIKQIEIKDINNLLKIFKGSRVLSNNNEEIMISNWIKPNSKIKVNLLYQISRDGDNISTFYNKVKNKYPTLILIKSKSGYKFGGYTTQTWEITDNWKRDELSFLFSLNKQMKYNIKNDQIKNAIYGCSDYFAFGSEHDLYIND